MATFIFIFSSSLNKNPIKLKLQYIQDINTSINHKVKVENWGKTINLWIINGKAIIYRNY